MASIGGKEITSPSVDDVSERKREDGDLDGTNDQQYLKQKGKSIPFHKLFSYADPADYVLMFVGILAAVGNGIAVPLMTVIFGNVINAFGQNATNSHDLVSDVSKVALTFVYLGLGNGVASFLQVACWTVTGERQASRIRSLYLKSILRQDIAYFDKEVNTGEIVGRMSGDILLVQDAMGEKVGLFIQSVSSFLGGFVVALIKGWELALVMLGTIPLIVLFAAAMSTIITKTAAHGQQTTSEAAAVAEQAISSIRTVASFTGEEQAVRTYSKFLTSAYKSSVLEGLASGIGLGATFAMAYLGYSLGIWVGSTLIMHKGYNGGEVINVMFAVAMGSMSLGQAAPSTTAFAAGQAAAAKMFDTINRIPEIDADGSEGKTLENIRGDIELKDVCFSYPTRPDDQILTGLSLFVPSAATVALVGESGCGKSTVISLIERFYDPVAGEVLVDGINLKDFHLRWIRMKIGLVSQEPILTASSIRENIAYSKENATTEEIWAAAELANASKFIGKLPQGLDTMVGDGGIQLSGGQKQRIAIARAVLKDPRILLLDEATSSLDVKSERLVQEALERIMSNRTSLLVAHRLSTVENADIIAVMHRGSIVEKGSHSELLKDPKGSYSRLISLQEVSFNQSSEENYAQEEEEEEEDIMLVGDYDHQLPSQLSKHGQKSPGEMFHSLSESFASPAGPGIQDKNLQGPKSDEASDQYKQVPLSRLAKLNKPEIPVILLGIVASIVSGVIFPVFGALLGSIVHTFYEPPPKLQRDSNFWSLMLLILALGTLISMPARAYFFAVAGSNLISRIRSMCFKRVVHMEIAWFDVPKNSAGVIGARLSADASAVRNLVGDTLSVVVQNASTFVCGLAIAFSSCWQLSLIILAMIPLMGLNGWIQMQLLQGYSSSVKVMHQEASRLASDAVRGIRTVASFSAEEKVMKLYKQRCEGPMAAGMKQGLISGIGFGFSFFLLFGSYALSFYAGARLVGNGENTFADIFRVFFALSFAAIGISQSSSLLPDATKAKSATASVFALLDGSSKIDSSSNTGMTLELVEGNIVFQNVSFAYPTRPGIQILRDLCLSVQSGETVALVGESGSGKSTIVSLLQRFYDADSGDIMIDGVEIKKLQLRWLRQQIGLVSQEPVLFNDSIRANIAYGKGGEATEAEILAAARLANADQFISGLHQGYDTLVGERGVQLSGGQKQRIAIARAIIKEPKILLLDEATSALDAQSERVVQTSLERVMTNRTAIVIAHRLSTVRGADLIAVIRNGAVEEKGKHEALMKINGVYASLVAIQ